jgi:hypothetical protein
MRKLDRWLDLLGSNGIFWDVRRLRGSYIGFFRRILKQKIWPILADLGLDLQMNTENCLLCRFHD